MAECTINNYSLTWAPPDGKIWTGQFATVDEAFRKALELAPTASFKKLHQLDPTEQASIPKDLLYTYFWYIICDGAYIGFIERRID